MTLAVGKGAITPTLNVEVGDTLTGSATVTEAVNPVEVHVWELDGSEAQRGSSATYTTTAAGSVRYRKEVTDDNNQSAVIGAWSDAVTVTAVDDPTKPSATMSGLRFDKTRNTHLYKNVESGDRLKWTWSAWIKPTGANGHFDVFNKRQDANVYLELRFFAGNKFGWYNQLSQGSAGAQAETTNAIPDNQWTHVVFVWDTANSTETDRAVLYVNGEKASLNVTKNPALNENNPDSNSYALGAYLQSGGQHQFNGYMSDVYFVDGEALEPEAFGKNIRDPGKWGPLDSAVVLENIKGKTKSPYEERPNMDEKWSDDAVSNCLLALDSSVCWCYQNVFQHKMFKRGSNIDVPGAWCWTHTVGEA